MPLIEFSTNLNFLFGALILLQLILLISFWPKKVKEYEEENNFSEKQNNFEEEDNILDKQINGKKFKKYFLPKYLLISLSIICSISSSLLNCFGYILFAFKQNNEKTFKNSTNDLLLFYFFALFARLFISLKLKQQLTFNKRKKYSFFLSQNFLFPVALFSAGSALCTLNSKLLHYFSVSLLGTSLSIFWPATWLQFINELNNNNITSKINKYQLSTSITILLISSNFGPFIFPFILTQIYKIYGGPELFTSLELFFIFLMVIAFVCVLNTQANQQQQITGNQFWHWFRGEGGRRTRRSIRLFVSSFRESLKRRQRTSRNRQNRRRFGTADSALLGEDCSFGHSALSNYHSFQTLNERITNNNSRQSNKTHLFCKQMSEQQKENNKNISKPNSPISLRRAQYSLPSIVIHQETPKTSRGSINS